MAESLPPGRLLLSKLQEMFMLSPSVVGRKDDKRYILGICSVILLGFWGTLWLAIGALSVPHGLMVGNFFCLHGKIGQIMSGLAVMEYSIGWIFHKYLLSVKRAPYIEDLLAYDNPLNQATVLKGSYRRKIETFLEKGVKIIIFMTKIVYINTLMGVIGIGIITPLIMEGFTLENFIFWTLSYLFNIVLMALYVTRFMIYILGLWFLCKSHLDMQVDYFIEKLNSLEKSNETITDLNIISLDHYYRGLVVRIKDFDKFSSNIITPYRTDMSFVCCAMVFAAHQQDNVIFAIGLSAIMAAVYTASIIFLSTGGSLSTKRRTVYTAANRLFVRILRDKKSWKQQIVLRRLLKSLGDRRRPTICLTDKSGAEFDPNEFVDFVAMTISNFFLVAELYLRTLSHVK